jgi:hypothetical protein
LQAGGQLVDPFRNGRAAQVLATHHVRGFSAALGDPIFALHKPQKLELVVYAGNGKRVCFLSNGEPNIQVDFFSHGGGCGALRRATEINLDKPGPLSTIIFKNRCSPLFARVPDVFS